MCRPRPRATTPYRLLLLLLLYYYYYYYDYYYNYYYNYYYHYPLPGPALEDARTRDPLGTHVPVAHPFVRFRTRY